MKLSNKKNGIGILSLSIIIILAFIVTGCSSITKNIGAGPAEDQHQSEVADDSPDEILEESARLDVYTTTDQKLVKSITEKTEIEKISKILADNAEEYSKSVPEGSEPQYLIVISVDATKLMSMAGEDGQVNKDLAETVFNALGQDLPRVDDSLYPVMGITTYKNSDYATAEILTMEFNYKMPGTNAELLKALGM